MESVKKIIWRQKFGSHCKFWCRAQKNTTYTNSAFYQCFLLFLIFWAVPNTSNSDSTNILYICHDSLDGVPANARLPPTGCNITKQCPKQDSSPRSQWSIGLTSYPPQTTGLICSSSYFLFKTYY
jgi:hypothetical protein